MYIHFDIKFKLRLPLNKYLFSADLYQSIGFFFTTYFPVLHDTHTVCIGSPPPPCKIKFSIDLNVLLLVIFSPFLMTSFQKGHK